MKEFTFSVPMSGYCRGDSEVVVKAESEEEAREILSDGEGVVIADYITRDDREHEWDEATLELTEDLS